MHIGYTPEQEQLRRELRDYFSGLMTPEVRAALDRRRRRVRRRPAYKQVVRQMGRTAG